MPTTRIVHWEERHVQIRTVQMNGSQDGIDEGCETQTAVVYSGRGRTNNQSFWQLDLARLQCLAPGNQPPSVVATPTEQREGDQISPPASPAILVAITKGQVIEIWSYSPGGGERPNVEFSWHCIVERRT